MQQLERELTCLNYEQNLNNILLRSDKEGLHFVEKTLVWKIKEFVSALFGAARIPHYELSRNLRLLRTLLKLNPTSSSAQKMYIHLSHKLNSNTLHLYGKHNNFLVEKVLKNQIPGLNIIQHEENISEFPKDRKIVLVWALPEKGDLWSEEGLNMMGRGLNECNYQFFTEKAKTSPNKDKLFVCFVRKDNPCQEPQRWLNNLHNHLSNSLMFIEPQQPPHVFLLDSSEHMDQTILNALQPDLRPLERSSLFKRVALSICNIF